MRMTIGCVSGMRHYLMQSFPFLQHIDKYPGETLASLRFFCGVESPDDRVPVGCVDGFEKRLCARIPVERLLKIRVNGSVLRRIVRCVPATILLRPFNLLESGGLHLSAGNQPKGLLAIDLRPDAARPARDETL